MNKKYILAEDFEDEVVSVPVEIVEVPPVVEETPIIEEQPQPSKEEVNKALVSLINDAIRREFDEINLTNADLATIKAEVPEKTDIINILETIITEKNIHVGMLTKILSLLDDGAQELMNIGIEKAEEIISEPATQDLN